MELKDLVKDADLMDFSIEYKEHDPETGKFSGYLARFGEEDSYRDIIKKGAFKRTLNEIKKSGRSVPILWQHNTREPIGVFTSIKEDNQGLLVEGKLVLDTQRGREANALIAAGALTGMSIGFRTVKSLWDEEARIRTLLDLDLMEGSLVTFPAMDKARIKKNEIKTIRNLETCLRDAGFSRDQAKGIAAHGFNGLEQRDAGAKAITQGIDDLLDVFKT